MELPNVRDLFKLVDCRKSQAKKVNAWYWTFHSVKTGAVQINVITYTIHDKADEIAAWVELEKVVIGSIIPEQKEVLHLEWIAYCTTCKEEVYQRCPNGNFIDAAAKMHVEANPEHAVLVAYEVKTVDGQLMANGSPVKS